MPADKTNTLTKETNTTIYIHRGFVNVVQWYLQSGAKCNKRYQNIYVLLLECTLHVFRNMFNVNFIIVKLTFSASWTNVAILSIDSCFK